MYKPLDTLQCIKDLLLKQVVFTIEEKTVRKGKLLLFSCDDYYVKFVLQTNKNVNKNYEIPYPYKVRHGDSYVTFSYKLLDLCRGNQNKLQYMLIHTTPNGTNKLHDKNLNITVIDTQ
jgi:hypothetical protein